MDEIQQREEREKPQGGLSQKDRVLAILDVARVKFVSKNKGYGNTGYVLGAAGQYADMNRKMGKLKHQLWDGNYGDEDDEDLEEILLDLIGHCALTIDYVREGHLR